MSRKQGKRDQTRKGRWRIEDGKKKAWIYTRIDAPEDSHGTLKKQYEQLNAYGEQLQLEIAGCSSDLGDTPGSERPGLELFLEEKGKRGIQEQQYLDSSFPLFL